jgi:hypothetical protein
MLSLSVAGPRTAHSVSCFQFEKIPSNSILKAKAGVSLLSRKPILRPNTNEAQNDTPSLKPF